MTKEELDQYDALSEYDKLQYRILNSAHPEWNHRQIFITIGYGCRGLIDDTPTKE